MWQPWPEARSVGGLRRSSAEQSDAVLRQRAPVTGSRDIRNNMAAQQQSLTRPALLVAVARPLPGIVSTRTALLTSQAHTAISLKPRGRILRAARCTCTCRSLLPTTVKLFYMYM